MARSTHNKIINSTGDAPLISSSGREGVIYKLFIYLANRAPSVEIVMACCSAPSYIYIYIYIYMYIYIYK